MLLNLDASHGISDLIENIDHLDHAFIQEIMVDGPLGLKLLLAPVRPELADLVMVDHVWRILSELRDMFDYIVVDSNGNLDDINLELIDLAHRIVVVTSGSLPSIKNTKLALKTFDSLAIPPDRILLVLNQPEAYSEFNTENVEANLRFPISLVIPNDTKLAVRSANRGEPFATKQPDAKISQKIRELVGTIIPEALASRARQ
jgi:pilus assembly protein CpaE